MLVSILEQLETDEKISAKEYSRFGVKKWGKIRPVKACSYLREDVALAN